MKNKIYFEDILNNMSNEINKIIPYTDAQFEEDLKKIIKKPIIIFYEPFEIMIRDTTKYLQETKITVNELLTKYDIDYESFFHSNIRDEKGYPILLQSKEDIHNFLLDYINN